MSAPGKSFIRKLLIKDEHRRLGSKNGASDVKSHMVFKNLNWALLRNQKAPIIPKTTGMLDTSNFRRLDDSLDLDLESQIPVLKDLKIEKIVSVGSSRLGDIGEEEEDEGKLVFPADPFEDFDSSMYPPVPH